MTDLAGAVGLSDLRVYDWPAADGVCGGTPHMHLACTETYVVIDGSGMVQTLTWSGYAETPLTPGSVVSFTPGTIHRLVNADGKLRIVVVMQNSGLPEAGDAVFTFPPEVLADPTRYGEAARITDAASARRRRDLAIEGFHLLRAQPPAQSPLRTQPPAQSPLRAQPPAESRQAGQPPAETPLADFHRAAARLIGDKLDLFEERWRLGARAAADATGAQLAALRGGDLSHLREAAVSVRHPQDRLGMCGHLRAY